MKKILFLILILVAASMAANVYTNPGLDVGFRPNNVKWYQLTDTDITDSKDSIATDEYEILGPYPVCSETNAPMHKAVGIIAGQLAAGDSLAISYQLTRGMVVSDTVSGQWNALDTITISGATQAYIDISDEFGEFIFFKVLNYTAGEVIVREIKAYFKKNYDYYYKR